MPNFSRPDRRTSTPFLSFLSSLFFLLACGAGHEESSAGTSPPAQTTPAAANAPSEAARPTVTAPRVHAEGETAPRNPNERPVPAFSGTTLDGENVAMRDLIGSRIVLFFFNPEVPPADHISRAVQSISTESGIANFEVLGIGIGSNSATLAQFVGDNALDFRVIDDSSGTITRTLRLRAANMILGVDADGYMGFAIGSFPNEGDIEAAVVADLRSQLRLADPAGAGAGAGALYAYPEAPELGVVSMSNGDRLEKADLAGRAAIVIFFLHTCPHCHHALAAIKSILESLPADQKPRLVAISIQNQPSAVRQAMKDEGIDFFDPYLDPGHAATERWGVTGGVPVVFILDAEGRIRHRGTGWDDHRDPGIVKMKAARSSGARVPMLLDPTGYSGNDVCGVCHEQEYATWQYTSHATAFDTLVTHSANRRTDCIGCHVVGFEDPGGYDFRRQPPHLENVGCESCHGRGGPHLTPNFLPKTDAGKPDYETVCATCHNPTHSLGFDYASFQPRISHQTIAALPDADRAELLGGAGPGRDLLPTRADYVGSDACQTCHQKEFTTWEASPHGHSIESLATKGKTDDPECLACHTTAYGKTGGFPPEAPSASHPDLARVGCESCHGPGGEHIGPTAKRVGTIVSLGDKCDSCVILKICGSCHDDANDPGFQFKVEERIEVQRHGTIEAAAIPSDDSADRERIREAFERLASRRDGVRPIETPIASPDPS
jgi:peroxiredoxin